MSTVEDAAYWKQKYQELYTLYQDKMKELSDFGFLLQQFSRETMTKSQKEELQKKLQATAPGPGSSPPQTETN